MFVTYWRGKPKGRARLQVTIHIGKAPMNSGTSFRSDEEHLAMQRFLYALHELQKVHARLNS